MNTEKKLFAFRLAEKQAKNATANNGKWKAREGVSAQACTHGSASFENYMATAAGDTSVLC